MSENELRDLLVFGENPEPDFSPLTTLSERLRITFPENYLTVLGIGSLGFVSKACCDTGTLESCTLYSVHRLTSQGAGIGIENAYENMLDGLDKSKYFFESVVPFGVGSNGANYCFDFRLRSEPIITKMDWDYHLLARSFEEFLDRSNPAKRESWLRQTIETWERSELMGTLPDEW